MPNLDGWGTAAAGSRGSPGFPYVTQDLARVGWRGLAPLLPIGPRERPRLADSFFAPGSGARGIPRVARPAIRRVAAMRGKERGPRRLSPALRGGKGIAGSPRAPQFGPPEGGGGATVKVFSDHSQAVSKVLTEIDCQNLQTSVLSRGPVGPLDY